VGDERVLGNKKKWLKEADEASDMEAWKWMRSLIKPLGEDGMSSDLSKSLSSEFYNIASN